MSELISRRELFCKEALKNILKTSMKEVSRINNEESWRRTMTQWVTPSLYSHAFFQDFTLEMIIDMADKKGIPTEGRSKSDIAYDVFCTGEDLWQEGNK